MRVNCRIPCEAAGKPDPNKMQVGVGMQPKKLLNPILSPRVREDPHLVFLAQVPGPIPCKCRF